MTRLRLTRPSLRQAAQCVAAGAQALLAEKARLAAEHAEMQQKNSLLLARLQLAEDSGAGLREGSPCSPLGEPAGAQDLPAKAPESPGACALGEAAGAQDLPAKPQESPGARAAALARELELMKGMLFECAPASGC